MNKADLIDAISNDIGCTKEEAKAMLESFVDNVTESLTEKERVVLVGFGVLDVKHRESRTARNPRNPSEEIEVPEKDVPVFRAGKNLKEAVE